MKYKGLKLWPTHIKLPDLFGYTGARNGYIPKWASFEIKIFHGRNNVIPVFTFTRKHGHNQNPTGSKELKGWIIIDSCNMLTTKEKLTARNILNICHSVPTTEAIMQIIIELKNQSTASTTETKLAAEKSIIYYNSILTIKDNLL